jgi:hypothetical protein
MPLLTLTAREGRLSSSADALLTPTPCHAALSSRRGIAVVCLGVEVGAGSGVKTGEKRCSFKRALTTVMV